jgi:hypothetical protein
MRALKVLFVLAGLLAAFRYLPVYYNSSEFNNYVRESAERGRLTGPIKQDLLKQATMYELPIRESDIVLTKTGSILRVSIDYAVPVDLFVISPELKFHVIGSGFIR